MKNWHSAIATWQKRNSKNDYNEISKKAGERARIICERKDKEIQNESK